MTNNNPSTAVNGKIHFDACPVCGSTQIKSVWTIKDHSISGEFFELMECSQCALRFTQDIPAQEDIGPYYKASHYISHSNSKEGLINKLYHRVREFTIRQKANLVEKVSGKNTGEVLDVGCGTGNFLAEMRKRGWTAEGLEPDADARELATSIHGIHSAEPDFLFQLSPASKDIITLWHVLEHVHQLHEYMGRFREILAPGGRLVIAVPNYTSYDARYYKSHWAAYDVPRHLYHFSPKSVQHLAQMHGMRVSSVHPMWFDSFYVSMLSEQYRKGSVLRAGITGLSSNLKALFNRQKCSSLIYVLASST